MKRLRSLFVACTVSIGILLMAYPFLSNYIFENRKDSVIRTYESQADAMPDGETDALLEKAREYNRSLLTGHVQLQDPFEEEVIGQSKKDYMEQLSINGSDVMGYIDIPCINVSLPIYHGTSAETLEKGIGHLEGTSLPVGDEGTHCVLTGHTGLNRSKLFTDLTQMEEGDLFVLTVLGEKLAYKVDQIKVIEPDQISDLTVEERKDYCTLVTCTPYGVNSHRLLVRGERTEYSAEEAVQQADTEKGSEWMLQYKKALAFAILLILLSIILIRVMRNPTRKKKKTIIRTIAGLGAILAGIFIYLYPNIQEWRLERRTDCIISEFEQKYGAGTDKSASGGQAAVAETSDLDGLYREMQEYNAGLVKNGQEIRDAWTYEQTPVNLDALSDGAVGYIDIPDMEVKLPLYIGASEENMALGAAVMAGTSMPIGGEDTNTVIAGHRGKSTKTSDIVASTVQSLGSAITAEVQAISSPVQTGDDTELPGYLAALLASAAAIVGVELVQRKKYED